MQGHEVTPPVAALMLSEIVSAGIAIPLVTVGIALVAVQQLSERRPQ